VEDIDAFLPTSAWREHRSSLAGNVDLDLWDQLVMAYAVLEADRARFVTADKLQGSNPLRADQAAALKKTSDELGQLRRQLAGGGGWLDAFEDEDPAAEDGSQTGSSDA
jgi:hypothetical protein